MRKLQVKLLNTVRIVDVVVTARIDADQSIGRKVNDIIYGVANLGRLITTLRSKKLEYQAKALVCICAAVLFKERRF